MITINVSSPTKRTFLKFDPFFLFFVSSSLLSRSVDLTSGCNTHSQQKDDRWDVQLDAGQQIPELCNGFNRHSIMEKQLSRRCAKDQRQSVFHAASILHLCMVHDPGFHLSRHSDPSSHRKTSETTLSFHSAHKEQQQSSPREREISSSLLSGSHFRIQHSSCPSTHLFDLSLLSHRRMARGLTRMLCIFASTPSSDPDPDSDSHTTKLQPTNQLIKRLFSQTINTLIESG